MQPRDETRAGHQWQALMAARLECRGARRSAGTAGWLVLGSIGLMTGVQLLLLLLLRFTGASGGAHRVLLEYLASCIGYLFLALVPLFYIFHSGQPISRFLPFRKPGEVGLTGGSVLLLYAVGMALTLASNAPTEWVQRLLEALGLSGNIPDMPLDHSIGTQIFYMVYGTLIPPLVEEILFRGAVVGCLRRYGDWFAILVSSLLFGLYHGNVGQFVFATLVGLVFAYLRVRTESLLPGIILHMLNNGLAAATAVLSQNFGAQAGNRFSAVYFLLTFGLAAAACCFWLLSRRHTSVRLWIPPERRVSTLGGRVRGLFTSAGGICMVLYGVLLSVSLMVRS